MDTKTLDWLNVLLVDDSSAILNYVEKVLNDSYQISNVYCASSASEAMQILRQPSNNINLLFLDLNMPNIDGIQFLDNICQLKYSGYVVIMSGVSTRIISSVELLTKEYGLNYIGTLLKPIHESDFKNIIEKIGGSRNKDKQSESLRTYEIVRAIKNNDIEVLYQPQIELNSRKLIGVEALCRMNHPRLGLISPDRFIEKAEQSELIIHITHAVLKRSCSDWNKWRRMGLEIKLSVNASPMSLQQPEFADMIFSLLEQYSIPEQMFCIEVTEGVVAENKTQELMNLNRLNMRGVAIALDDFGKENATVERLQKLPLTYLKLDKSYFIDNRETIGQISIIKTSLSLASQLHIKTIAEGIEDADILNLVTELGCDYAQGFYISRPIPAKEVLAWSRYWNDLT
ncbi:MAG: EAL domain-containing protein (putative c-di-GMP-specific phosphodiesterase class I) [Alteromonadaceae bacterium]|jgi:EAL domain-containing protein (putative c-di-GMP-specific phosphodiesterase class I)/CheY-like chemotaxis protein